MSESDDEVTTKAVGLSTRDLVIQANTKLDVLGPEVRDIRAIQARQQVDIDALKTAQAVRKASSGMSTDIRRAFYAAAVLAAYWFGPVIDKAITH